MLWISVLGCVPQVSTEGGQLRVEAPDLRVIGNGATSAPLLEGTRTCPTVVCAVDCPPTEDPVACFSISGNGSVNVGGGCWDFGDPGAASIAFDVVPCAANGEGYAPLDDQIRFEVVDPEPLSVRVTEVETLVEATLSPGLAGAFPADWRQTPGEPWTLVAESPFTFFPALYTNDGREVGWTLAEATASATTTSGTPPTLSVTDGDLTVELGADTAATIVFGVGDASWPMLEVRAAAIEDVESIEVVAAYFTDPTAGTSAPAGARAILRDAAGGLVWGAPIAWTLDDGLLALDDPSVLLPGEDYVTVTDACVLPSQNRGLHSAVLRATLGSLSATVDLDWRVGDGGTDDGFVPSPLCVEGSPPVIDSADTGTPPDTVPDDTDVVPDPDDDEDVPVEEDPHCACATGGSSGWLAALLLPFLARRRKTG